MCLFYQIYLFSSTLTFDVHITIYFLTKRHLSGFFRHIQRIKYRPVTIMTNSAFQGGDALFNHITALAIPLFAINFA